MMLGVVDELDSAPAPSARPRRPRTDAARNRAALLSAAQALYAERGIDVSLEEIARAAGVGIGTLYRNFPRGKEQLVSEALVGQVTRYVDAAHRALALSDPWQGFVTFVTDICAMQEGDAGFSDVLATVLPGGPQVEELRSQANDLAIELIDRAKAAGKLRADVVGEDLLLLLIANAAILSVTRHDAPGASRRVVTLFLDAVGTKRSRAALPDPPTSEEMLRAMTRLAAARGCASDTEALAACPGVDSDPETVPTNGRA
jgi:AcrR family transcriptional regulator